LAAVREAKIMSILLHPNVIQFHTSFVEGDHIYILMEYAEKGDLNKYISHQK
jgi:serine/threonine protein kinase